MTVTVRDQGARRIGASSQTLPQVTEPTPRGGRQPVAAVYVLPQVSRSQRVRDSPPASSWHAETLASPAASSTSCLTTAGSICTCAGRRTRLRPTRPTRATASASPNGVDRDEAAVLFAEQRPAAQEQFSQRSGRPAVKVIPSWSLIGKRDHVIPLALQGRCPAVPARTSPRSRLATCR